RTTTGRQEHDDGVAPDQGRRERTIESAPIDRTRQWRTCRSGRGCGRGDGSRLMPNQKPPRGAAKRFRRTGGGKIRRRKQLRSHLLEKKSSTRKRRLGRQ